MGHGAENRPILNERLPLYAAIGALLGVLLACGTSPMRFSVAAGLLLLVMTLAVWCGKRRLCVVTACVLLFFVYGTLRLPAGGRPPSYGAVIEPDPSGLYAPFLSARETIGAHIDELFPQYAGVARGMLLGDRSGIPPAIRDAYRDAGMLHLLAVSGLHVSTIAGAFSLLFRRNAALRVALTALFCAFYAALTAFSPSVLRASIMLVYALAGTPLQRRPDPVISISLAFVTVLLLNPTALFYTGFQLSFCAVYGLILLGNDLRRPIRWLGEELSALLAASAAVQIASLPAMAAAFGEVSPMPVLTNLIVLPLVPFFFLPAFASVVVSFVSFPAASVIAVPARITLRVLVTLAETVGRTAIRIPPPSLAAYLLFLAALLFFSRLFLRDVRTRAFTGTVLLAVSALIWTL